MLTRLFLRRCIGLSFNSIGIILPRNFSSDRPHDDMTDMRFGGLDKLQGGLKEETYFSQHDMDLIVRIREQGTRLKCENCLGNWTEFEKTHTTSLEKTALRETCSVNKHKNCMEEAFFMNEQNDEMKIFQDKLKLDNKTDCLKMSQIKTDKKSTNSDNSKDKENPPPIK